MGYHHTSVACNNIGRDAFTSRDMIARTPMSQKTNPVHSTKHFTKENTAALSLVLSKGEKEEEEEKEKVEEEKEEEEEEEEKEEEVEEEGGKKKKKEEYLSQTPLQVNIQLWGFACLDDSMFAEFLCFWSRGHI